MFVLVGILLEEKDNSESLSSLYTTLWMSFLFPATQPNHLTDIKAQNSSCLDKYKGASETMMKGKCSQLCKLT